MVDMNRAAGEPCRLKAKIQGQATGPVDLVIETIGGERNYNAVVLSGLHPAYAAALVAAINGVAIYG